MTSASPSRAQPPRGPAVRRRSGTGTSLNGSTGVCVRSAPLVAAGAYPVKIGLVGDLPGELTPGQWFSVVGGYAELVDRDPRSGAPIPYLAVVEATPIPVPPDPYE